MVLTNTVDKHLGFARVLSAAYLHVLQTRHQLLTHGVYTTHIHTLETMQKTTEHCVHAFVPSRLQFHPLT